jgi:hypothetical protein
LGHDLDVFTVLQERVLEAVAVQVAWAGIAGHIGVGQPELDAQFVDEAIALVIVDLRPLVGDVPDERPI